MKNVCYFYIDDVIWLFRDLTRERPASMFDNAFLKMLKEAHDKYGLKVQLNVFYRTDFFYGEDEFTLSEMTDAYKKEWEEASDWIKFGFHAKQEFPDYPYVNADYETVKINLDRTKEEVFRFAGENSFALGCVPHWMPMSKDGVKALRDGGIKVMNCTEGEIAENVEGIGTLCLACEGLRVLYNKKPETRMYRRPGNPDFLGICAYNHLSSAEANKVRNSTKTIFDEETGMHFRKFTSAPCLNTNDEESVIKGLNARIGSDFIGYMVHEQYFYSDYFKWNPDYKDKVLTAARILHENGYKYIFIEDLVD